MCTSSPLPLCAHTKGYTHIHAHSSLRTLCSINAGRSSSRSSISRTSRHLNPPLPVLPSLFFTLYARERFRLGPIHLVFKHLLLNKTHVQTHPRLILYIQAYKQHIVWHAMCPAQMLCKYWNRKKDRYLMLCRYATAATTTTTTVHVLYMHYIVRALWPEKE